MRGPSVDEWGRSLRFVTLASLCDTSLSQTNAHSEGPQRHPQVHTPRQPKPWAHLGARAIECVICETAAAEPTDSKVVVGFETKATS